MPQDYRRPVCMNLTRTLRRVRGYSLGMTSLTDTCQYSSTAKLLLRGSGHQNSHPDEVQYVQTVTIGCVDYEAEITTCVNELQKLPNC